MAGVNDGRKRKTSVITLYSNVPFDDTYKNVVNWENKDELNRYLDQEKFRPITHEGSYHSLIKPVRWNSKRLSFNDLMEYNYMKIVNTDNVNQKVQTYYAFITRIEYENDHVTYIYFSIDMFNTYKYDIDYKKAMVEQGFVRELNADYTDWSDDFRQIRHNQQPIGGDGAQNLKYSSEVLFNQNEDGSYFPDSDLKWLVIVAQPQDVGKEPGSYLGSYSQYHYLVMPYSLNTMRTVTVYNKDGERIYQGDEPLDDKFKTMTENEYLVGSTSKVVDAEIYDYIGIPFVGVEGGIKFTKSVKVGTNPDSGGQRDLMLILKFEKFSPQHGSCFTNPYSEDSGKPNEMGHGKNMFERLENFGKSILPEYWKDVCGSDYPYMLLASPFTALVFTDGRGTHGMFDIFKYNHLNFNTFPIWRWSGIAENGKQVYSLPRYNRDTLTESDQGTLKGHENALMVDDSARDTPIILDNYAMFLQSNKNQLANTRTNARISRDLSMQGNQISLGQTQRGVQASQDILGNNIATSYEQFENANSGTFAQYGYQGVLGTVGNLLTRNYMGAIGSAGGAVTGALGSAIGMHYQGQSLDISARNQRANQQISNNVTMENARENFAFSNKVATNNYEATIRSQEAMLADVQNANDVIAHQGTGQMWDSQNGNLNMSWQIYTCQDSIMLNACLWFNLFGYRVHLFDDIRRYMYKKTVFNYVRTSNANVSGRVNQDVIRTFNLMLDNGVTFWSPDKLEDFEERRIINNHWR